jgi:endo-1,4-beta-xylanase
MAEVQHFGSAIYVWDVINEPLDPNQPDCLAHGPFYQVLGPGYLEIALRAARQSAPPGTQLFINDYSTTDPKRLECLISVVARLRLRGVPLDGVGHEMHNHIDNPSPASMFGAIETLARLFPHLHQQVTELDVSVYPAGDNTSNYGANGGKVPDSLIAEQGWLYEKYFTVFRRLKGKLDAVTIWGIGDDNTWLDSFPISRLDLPLPFDTRLQAKPAYWGIVDPTKLPGFGLSLALVSRTGPPDNRVWTLTATNPSAAAAQATEITGFFLRQVEGAPCRPVVTPPSSYPVLLGDIAPTSSASAAFTIDFGHCSPHAEFILRVPWRSATYETGTLSLEDLHP